MAGALRIQSFAIFFAGILFPLRGWCTFGPAYSFFSVKCTHPAGMVNGLCVKSTVTAGNYLGICFSGSCTRNTFFSIGAGLSHILFQKEVQGIFPEAGQYGFVNITGRSNYWTFLFSYEYRGPAKGCLSNGLRISYIPCVQGSVNAGMEAAGGGVQSAYATNYIHDGQIFQHSLAVAFINQLRTKPHTLKLDIDPFFGIGSGYFKSDGTVLNTMSFGIEIRLHLVFPEIEIYREKPCGNSDQKKKLGQKQKEIEEQFKNKPE